MMPILIYDDRCLSCTKFAEIVKLFTRNKISFVGHYSGLGNWIRESFFPEGYDATRMFWFIENGIAYGARAGVRRLILFTLKSYFTSNQDKEKLENNVYASCDTECKTPKKVLMRSASLIQNSETIALRL